MEFYGFMLANYAEVNRGLLYVQSGGWEFATVDEVPGILQPSIAGFLVLPRDSTLDSVALELALETPAGEHVAVGSTFVSLARAGTVDGEVQRYPVAFHMPLPISGAGNHAVLITGGGRSARLPVFVRVPPNT